MPETLNAIRRALQQQEIEFRELHHEPTRTSEDAASVRGEPLEIGGKAIVLKVNKTFALFVLPAHRKLDSSAIKTELGVRKTRFATADELMEHTGLVPGSVPPFGRPILPFDLYVDEGIESNRRIAFNAGSLTDSIIMATKDYFRLAKPVKIFPFAAVPTSPA